MIDGKRNNYRWKSEGALTMREGLRASGISGSPDLDSDCTLKLFSHTIFLPQLFGGITLSEGERHAGGARKAQPAQDSAEGNRAYKCIFSQFYPFSSTYGCGILSSRGRPGVRQRGQRGTKEGTFANKRSINNNYRSETIDVRYICGHQLGKNLAMCCFIRCL